VLRTAEIETVTGQAFFAEIESAPRSVWRPWPGRWSRWWFEVKGRDSTGDVWQFGYEPGMSGGGFTLGSCVRKASAAAAALADLDEGKWLAEREAQASD
jgi:hypothetical protein